MRKVSSEYSGLLITMYIERVHALQLIHFRGVSRAQTTFDSNQNKHRQVINIAQSENIPYTIVFPGSAAIQVQNGRDSKSQTKARNTRFA